MSTPKPAVTVGALIYLYLRHNRSFYFVRNMLMISMAIALVAYAAFPTAPPRFMPEWGFFDPVADFTGVHIDTAHGGSGTTTALTNLYAAVPSMHVAFALLIGWPLARLVRWRALRVLWLLYPLLMAFVIIATANHFVLDALLGAVTAAALGLRRAVAGARAPCRLALLAGAAGGGEHVSICLPGTPPQRDPPGAAAAADLRSAQNGEAAAGTEPRVPARVFRTSGQRRELVRNRLIESRLTPNAISLTGLALNVVAAVLVWESMFFLGGIAFVVGSVMDTLDGRYSRMSGKGTPFGAFLDSTLDRIEEGIVLTAVAGYFALQGNRMAAAAVVVAVLASLMVSYTRARAEALGVECKVGIATRPVRVVILSIGLIFAKGASLGHFELLQAAVYVLAALSVVTVVQRIWHVRRELSRPPA